MDKEVSLPNHNFEAKGKKALRRVRKLIGEISDVIQKDDFSPSRLKMIKMGYEDLSGEEKPFFFNELLRKVETSKQEIESTLKKVLAAQEGDLRWNKLLSELRIKAECPRVKLFRKFINISEGLKFLLELRRDIIAIQRRTALDLGPLDENLSYLFDSWFQSGFLILHEITLNSPYSQINHIQRHDMVHPMTTLEEMGERLGHDRRCLALYHCSMPDEPVIFIEVALTKGIPRSIHEIIGEQAKTQDEIEQCDTAIFYSINNSQEGLTGIGLGKILIFQVVDYIKRTVPNIQSFSTLSPIPGFWKNYLKKILEGKDVDFKMAREKIIETFSQKSRKTLEQEFSSQTGSQEGDFGKVLLGILSDPTWIKNPSYVKQLEKPLVEITHYYLTKEKNARGKPLNPVANFHLANGATISKKHINFLGNRSLKGLEESCGLMVNYVYSQSWFQRIRKSFQSLLRIEGGFVIAP